MPPTGYVRGRAQTLLLGSKILNSHEGASPLILMIDSLEQPAKPLLQEYVRRARANGIESVFVSFETLSRPKSCDYFVPAFNKSLKEIRNDIHAITTKSEIRKLLIIDNLLELMSDMTTPIAHLLFSFVNSSTTLVAVYHSDQLKRPMEITNSAAYMPNPVTSLRYVATTVLTLYPLRQKLKEQIARQRSVAAPQYGLREVEEGILQGANVRHQDLVFEMDHRRKSGRSTAALFVLGTETQIVQDSWTSGLPESKLLLLDEHPAMRAVMEAERSSPSKAQEATEAVQASFSLELTEQQRQMREGVILPYFDAQSGHERMSGDGGRILYNMGIEDDFDDEEDEI